MSKNKYYFPLREVQVGLFSRGAKCTNLTQKSIQNSTLALHRNGESGFSRKQRNIYEFEHCLQANPKISALMSYLWSWPVHRSP